MKEIAPLGMRTKLTTVRKIFFRKYNTVLQKMESFGFSLMLSYPRAITMSQLEKLL